MFMPILLRLQYLYLITEYLYEKIELDIVALSHSVTQSHNYAVVLGEQGVPPLADRHRQFEAQVASPWLWNG